MRRRLSRPGLWLALVAALCGCGAPVEQDAAAASSRTIDLIQRFDPGLVEPAPTPIVAPERTEWVFADGADWRPIQGLGGTAVSDGVLSGRTTSRQPILELRAVPPRGKEDQLRSVVVRARVAEGGTLSVSTLSDRRPPSAALLEGRSPGPLALRTPLLPGEEMRTYTIDVAKSFPGADPMDRSVVERVLVMPTDKPGARFEIESVRLIFHKEYLATVPSGIGWHGLGGIYHETLVTRSPEAVRFRVELPRRPWLDLAIGTIDPAGVGFRVEVAEPDATEGETVLTRTVATPEHWVPQRVELGRWAGRRVDLLFRTESDTAGAVALWGTAVIRSAVAPGEPLVHPQGIILFICDTLRRDHLQAYGYERRDAPALAGLAEEGTLFLDAVSQATWTKPSVPSILSSTYPRSSGVHDTTDRLPASTVTLAEALRQAGYATLATSSVPFTGQLSNLQQGVEELHESTSLEPGRYQNKSAQPFTDRVLDWIERHRDVPFYALLHALDPHSPYEPRPPFDGTWFDLDSRDEFLQQMKRVRKHIASPFLRGFGMARRDELLAAGVDPAPYVEREQAWYDGSILGMDVEVQRIIDRLEALGLSKSVLFVFVSDHGEEFLEHGNHWHGLNVYGETSDIPMLFWGPEWVPEGAEVEATVEALDVMPTILELAGIEIPASVQGRSLVRLMRTSAEARSGGEPVRLRRPAITERLLQDSIRRGGGMGEQFNYYAVTSGDWKLVRKLSLNGEILGHELYDHVDDRLDQHDVAAEHPQIVERLAYRLDRWLEWAETHRTASDAEAAKGISAAELERLRSLGYVQ